jgi:hypothetical protein
MTARTLMMKQPDSDIDECDSEIGTYPQDFLIHDGARGGGNVAYAVAMGEMDIVGLRKESV